MISNEQLIANFEAKKKALISEANSYVDDKTVPLSVSMELYARIDRLKFAIEQLKKRTETEIADKAKEEV